MSHQPDSAYGRAQDMIDEAKHCLPVGGAIEGEGQPIPYAQALAIAALGQAMLALCDELSQHRD